jgi:hypothetical protein
MVVYIFSIGWDIGTVSLIGLSFETWADGLKGMGSSRVACHLDHSAEFPKSCYWLKGLNNSDLQGSITKP